jgi:ribosomal protein L7Ae-like RNA K-turn-binding protein
MGLVSLGRRAGSVVVGTSGVRAALQRGELALVMVASDRSARTDDKVLRLATARGIPSIVGPRADDLGRCVGRGSVQAVGVRDAKLAAGIRDRAAEGAL